MIGRPGRSRSRHLSQNQNRCGPVFGGLVVVGGRMPWLRPPRVHEIDGVEPTTPSSVCVVWLVGLLLTHDLLLGPVVHLAGRWVRREPEAWRWPLQVGLVVSGVLALASVPVLYGVGRATQPGNDSVLPGDYPRALAGVLALAAVRHLRAQGRTVRIRAP